MKRQILFVQGGGAGTHDEWDDKLVASLQRELGSGCEIRYPRMPNEDDPNFEAWKAALDQELAALGPGAILVGHSIGGAMLINVLAAWSAKAIWGAIMLVAPPFVGEGGWAADDLSTPRDLGARLPKGVPVHLFQGLDDDTVPVAHVELYTRAVPALQVHRLPGRDHQLNNELREVAAAIRSLEAES